MSTGEWAMADEATRRDMVGNVWTYATQTATGKLLGANQDKWVLEAQQGDPITAILDKAVDKNRKAAATGYKLSLMDHLDAGEMEEALTTIEKLKQAGTTDSSIKSSITSHFKPLYQAAVARDDWATILEIESTLEELDMGYTEKTFSGWIPKEEEADEIEDASLTDRSRWLNRNGM
jgi:hypothetical protein